MNPIKNCVVENCIPTPSSCVDWNGGEIKYLGLCNGDSLNNIVWEIVNKLEGIAGEDLSSFDIDSLIEVCNQKAPLEVDILSILNILKSNDICLKNYILTLEEQIAELAKEQGVNVNLKCYADFDNLGNSLNVTRTDLDQLVINKLCDHKDRIESLESQVVLIKSDIQDIQNELSSGEDSIATCINTDELPTSQQVINTSEALCDLQDATGTPGDIATALGQTPAIFTDAEYLALEGWTVSPSNWAENYSNLLVAFNYLLGRVTTIEDTCCQVTCDDIELGFTVGYNEDNTAILISFNTGAGTSIPAGFEDVPGLSTGTITDSTGNVYSFTIDIVDNFTNLTPTEVPIVGLNTLGNLTIDITSKLTNGSITCQSCLSKVAARPGCDFCEVTATGEVTITYKVCTTVED